jgi:hypothetical protein
VNDPRASTILVAVIAAGLLAGLVVGLFHYVATEPVIEQAIELESAMHHDAEEAAPVVTRDTQRVGGVVGWVLIGLAMGLIFGVVCVLVRPRFGNLGLGLTGLCSALAAYWLIALFPFLKYPANPPGVGDPETVTYRQILLVLFWVLSVGGVLVAGWVYRLLDGRTSAQERALAAAGAYAVYALALFALMPPNPDPVAMPAAIVGAFRALSLTGLTLFWLVLGVAFGLALRWSDRGGANGAPGRAA